MIISQYNSRKIRFLNFFLIVLVLYIHNYYTEGAGLPLTGALQRFSGSNGLASVAVPMFFLLSGLLFFNNVDSVKSIYPKQKKRVGTILVPYVIWNFVYVLWFILLSRLPGIRNLINNDYIGLVFNNGVLYSLKQLFYLPIAFHLWFLRDLIFMIFLSPLLYVTIRRIKWFTPLLILGIMILLRNLNFFNVLDYNVVRLDGIVFFCLGGCISTLSALESIELFLKRPIVILSSIVFLGNALFQVFGQANNIGYYFLVALCGCIVVWRTYDYLWGHRSDTILINIGKKYERFFKYSFFIYLFHEPTLNIIKKCGLKILGLNDWSLLLLYIVNPIIMIIVSIAIAEILRKFIPTFYNLLTGNR